MTSQPNGPLERLQVALEAVGVEGVEGGEGVEDLTAMLELLAVPSRLAQAARFLSLEWLGARDSATLDNRTLRHRDLLAVICRVATVDAVTDLRVEDAATILGVQRPDVVDLIDAGHLWSYNAGRGPRVPNWQLVRDSSDSPIRLLGTGLPAVISAIPGSAVPSLVRRLMTTEDTTLVTEAGRAATPAEWIATGRAPWPVMAILLRNLTGNGDRATPLLFSPDAVW